MSARHPETSFSSSATIVPSLYQKPPAPITPPSSSIALPSIHNLPPVHSSSRSSQWPLNQRHYSPSHHQSPAYNFPPIEQHSRISQLQANPSSFGHHQQSAHMLPMLTTATTMNSYSATSHGDHVDLDHRNHHHPHSLSTSIVSTQQMLPQQHPSNLFDRPSSSVSGVSTPPPDFLNPDIGSTSVMYTDDVASQETQYLRRKCSNCGTTKPPSWRHSTLNLGKLVRSSFLCVSTS
ncbi:hypothetical protein M408DRAFT_207908 [Serendipita vermifera MAFF 305830]|uniref:GATA-type domain-containing protein n=1 Tax=Serendipita vermifera MAFF 305830 TaxID=933852 RepID=A0A0C3ALS7_SERVB|nr:hypothetical protein M408DRAFT_207908 [Serendipita vermifera MAFF 305830]